jgi:hypothetical protein
LIEGENTIGQCIDEKVRIADWLDGPQTLSTCKSSDAKEK